MVIPLHLFLVLQTCWSPTSELKPGVWSCSPGVFSLDGPAGATKCSNFSTLATSLWHRRMMTDTVMGILSSPEDVRDWRLLWFRMYLTRIKIPNFSSASCFWSLLPVSAGSLIPFFLFVGQVTFYSQPWCVWRDESAFLQGSDSGFPRHSSKQHLCYRVFFTFFGAIFGSVCVSKMIKGLLFLFQLNFKSNLNHLN